MDPIKFLKWASTVFVLSGIVLTSVNIFPLNIIIHGIGALGWTIAGYVTKDKALLTNFLLQLPIFAFGITRYLMNG